MPIEVETTSNAGRRRRMRGITINIGRTGLLADVGIRVPVGAACRIRFRDAAGLIEPAETAGRVVHVGVWTHRRTAIGIAFDRR